MRYQPPRVTSNKGVAIPVPVRCPVCGNDIIMRLLFIQQVRRSGIVVIKRRSYQCGTCDVVIVLQRPYIRTPTVKERAAQAAFLLKVGIRSIIRKRRSKAQHSSSTIGRKPS